MRFKLKQPPVQRQIRQVGNALQRDLRRGAVLAVDQVGQEYYRALQQAIRSAGLGRLADAVGYTSTRRQGSRAQLGNPFAVVFARGGDDSLSGGALESYSRGAYITAQRGQWLAFATNAIPRFVSVGGRRFRTTPQLYSASTLASSIGPLEFRPLGNGRAILVVKNVSLSAKTGRAKALRGQTRTRIPQKEVVAFVLIRATARAKRFDKDRLAFSFTQRLGGYMNDYLNQRRAG